MRPRLLLLVCASLAIACWPISTSSQELSPAEIGVLAVAFAIVLAVQCGFAWLTCRYGGRYADPLADALLVTFVTANAYYFAFLTIEAHWQVRAFYGLLIGVAAGVLQRTAVKPMRIALFTAVFVALALGQYAYGRMLPPGGAEASASDAIPVRSKTNVYMISIESLHSPYAFRRLYGITRLPHVDYLKAEGFRVFDEAYSADMDTRSSYQRILGFSKFLSTPQEMRSVFRVGNATFDSFKKSGYGVQFIYVSNYLDVNHNLIDYGYPAVGFYICDHLPGAFYYFVCRAPVRKFINRALFDTDGAVEVDQELAQLTERIQAAAADTKPWLTISHINYPGHSGHVHRYDSAADVAGFREGVPLVLPAVADHYRQIVSTIKTLDPHAVIVTFGDHGMWLTRGMDGAVSNALFSAQDYIQDRFGVMLAVYPADFCRNRIFEGSSTTTIVKSIIACLDGNDAPTAEERARSRSVTYKGALHSVDSIGVETSATR